jgi:metal-responsive CopG/Arc/MetJ family transcriptional regulator
MAKMTKVLISVPPELIEKLDAEAKRRGISRSELLRRAAGKEVAPPALTRRQREEIVADLRKARDEIAAERGDRPFDGTAFIRWDRDHGHSV